MAKVYLQSLGCPKNQVDSEMMLGLIVRDGGEIVLDPELADVVVVNTCGFIADAKRESIDTILELAQLKEENPAMRLVVTGCLVQRYGSELQQELPEVDAFLGTGDFTKLPELLRDRIAPDASPYRGAAHIVPDVTIPRLRSGQFFSAYLKVSEGCDHTCSFCIIPKIRGRHESRSIDSVVAEAERLASEGVVELNLVAQDLTAFGRDRRDGTNLARLLRALARVDGLQWIRLLYNYPRWVTDELLDTIASEPKVCPYIDIPLQHISDRMLRSMYREADGSAIRSLLARIRERIPGVAIRTAFIVGFPGESDEDFAELVDFVRTERFERVGVFQYSREEGTVAAQLPDTLSAAIRRRRYHALMREQAVVAEAMNRTHIGRVLPLLVCGQDQRGRYYGRLATQAPEIDGVVYLADAAPAGEILPVRIIDSSTYDLRGEVAKNQVDTLFDCH
jgi:ribosomal protein S12 methylthiotransferase